MRRQKTVLFMLMPIQNMLILLFTITSYRLISAKAIDIFDVNSMEPIEPNYCNNSDLLDQAGLIRSTLGQFLGFECSAEFYHCRWQSDGFRTYRKACRIGLVYDTLGTQNCNYDYNVKGCSQGKGDSQCNSTTSFWCTLSEQCVPMHKRCDGTYDCALEEDEQNCPLCQAGEFACIVSEECIPIDRRCNANPECSDGTDERDCDVCGHGYFHCGKSNECVNIEHRCDGHRDCPHGEDEMLCRTKPTEKTFTCESRDEAVPMRQVCDGMPHCRDGSDEKYCEIVPGQPAGPQMSLSSNPRPPAPEPAPEPAPTPQIYEEVEIDNNDNNYEDTDNADNEQVEEDYDKPSFPMFSILPSVNLPPTPVTPPPTEAPTTTRRTTTMRRTTTTPQPTTTEAPVLQHVAFSRPKPNKLKVRPQLSSRTLPPATSPQRAIFVQPTFIEVTAAPEESVESYSEELPETTTVRKIIRTRKPSTMRVPISAIKGRKIRVKTTTNPTNVRQSVVPRNQKPAQVRDIPARVSKPQLGQSYGAPKVTARVTAPPEFTIEKRSPASRRVVKSSLSPGQTNLLEQLSSHLDRKGASADLINQLERLFIEESTELETTQRTTRRLRSRRPTWRSFISKVTRPGSRTVEFPTAPLLA